MKDLANTPTQIACGWRLYGDLEQLATLVGAEVTIDLLSGRSTADGREVSPRLELADAAASWMGERLERDGVPDGTVTAATLTLKPRHDDRGSLVVECATILTTTSATYDSRDTTRWHPGDLRNP
jgi:hypothetical protein